MGYLGRRIEGATVPLRGTFHNAAGQLADPTTVILRVKPADGPAAVYRYPTPGPGEGAIARNSLGVYQVDHAASAAGVNWVRWEGTGNVAQVDEDYLYVDASEIV